MDSEGRKERRDFGREGSRMGPEVGGLKAWAFMSLVQPTIGLVVNYAGVSDVCHLCGG